MRLRPDLLDADSPAGIAVVQLTDDPATPASHVYMEAQVFSPDSARFVLHRSCTAHGGNRDDPNHQYLVCDVGDEYSLHPITEELGATAPSVSPDGQWLYYLVDRTEVGGGELSLKRVKLDGTERETLLVLDRGLPGGGAFPSRIYALSTISSDGRRLAAAAFLGDGRTEDAPYGLLVFDLTTAEVGLVLEGASWCNLHPQYSRSREAEASHDILVQENHGNAHDARGRITTLVGGRGGDIHVIRDDGAERRDLPWGRDGVEFCQGHQCWRGTSEWAITSTYGERGSRLVEGLAAPHAGHLGLATPGGLRNDLTRDFPEPRFCHFGCDAAGQRLLSDAGPTDDGGRLLLARLGEPGRDVVVAWQYLLNPRSSWRKEAHVHPFLFPDGRMGLFNSDESGTLQAYAVTGLGEV
jgi:hypothetical protein